MSYKIYSIQITAHFQSEETQFERQEGEKSEKKDRKVSQNFKSLNT